ncbi:MAG: hypothetical protein IAF38_21975 [Bacteroidia bacterium]|nr:hypothetical protein [Bacteroidia bacterium]
MKRIISMSVFIAISFFSSAQTDTAKTKLKPYASLGISIGHVDPNDSTINNFGKASYPSVEFGVMGKNLSLGAVFGCENMFVNSSSRGFYELKTSVSVPVGKCSAYALFGVGAYFEKHFNNFLEYGAGFSYMPGRFGYFVQYSNWARTNYISTGFTVGF